MTGCRPGAIARPAATLLFAAAVASCTDTVLTPPDESPITIAGTRAATGPLSTEGRNMERGFRLAVEMLNDVGGIARGGHGLAVGDRRNPGGRVAGPSLLNVHRDGAGAVRRGASRRSGRGQPAAAGAPAAPMAGGRTGRARAARDLPRVRSRRRTVSAVNRGVG